MSGQSQHHDEDSSVQETSDEEQRGEIGHSASGTVRADYNNFENTMKSYFEQVMSGVAKIGMEIRKKTFNLTSEAEAQKSKADMLQALMNIRSQRTVINELQSEVEASRCEIEKLKQEKAKMRGMILANSGVEKISDDEIRHLFTALRQQIQAIAHSKAFALDQKVTMPLPSELNLHKFYNNLNTHQAGDRFFLMRGHLFQVVVDLILKRNLFGIAPTQHIDLEHIENSLQGLENYMVQSQVSTDTVADWRFATMKAIGLIGFQHSYDAGAFPAFFSFLNVLILQQATRASWEKLHRDVYLMCQTAYRLRFLMRKSKDQYACKTFSDAILHRNDSRFEVHGVEHGGVESNIVAFTISPALMKCSGAHGENLIVLEPAHVVVRSASDAT